MLTVPPLPPPVSDPFCSLRPKIGDFASTGAVPSPVQTEGRSSRRYIPRGEYRRGYGVLGQVKVVPVEMASVVLVFGVRREVVVVLSILMLR